MKLNRTAKLILYALYVCVIAFVVTEAVARLFWVSDGKSLYWKRTQLFVFDEQLGYGLSPGFHIRGEENRLHPGVDLRINRVGMRGAELDGKDVVLVVGDSIVFGFGVQENDTVASQLKRNLGESFEVLNAGVPGYNAWQVRLWTTRLMGKVSVKKVVLVMNANDAEPSYYR